MERVRWQIDLKSLVIGFLLAVVAALLLNGRPGSARAQPGAVAADDQGVYIMHGQYVRYVEKQKCMSKACSYFSD